MANLIKQVEYYYTKVADRPGAGAKILNALKAEGVNLLVYVVFPATTRSAQLDFVPADTQAFLAAAQKARIKLVGPKIAFLIQGDDKVGAVADIAAKLAKTHINITAMDALAAGQGRYGAILWVKPRNVKPAAQVLGAS